jgi:predicted hydrocarbon binding protein
MEMTKKTIRWVQKVTEGLEAHADPEVCARILEACGRQCAPKGLIEKAREIHESSENVGEFLARLGEIFEAVQVEDNKVFVVYPECYCEQIKGVPAEEVPNAYCNCSVGWVKAVFEGAIGRPVRVKLVSTVVAGDPECRFEVDLS